MSYHTEEDDETDKDTGMLLNLSQKSGIFVADQTPTPTRLIKNCEEVGLFDDLRNVNPFDETFRRACEQNVQHTPSSHQQFHNDENSLHTPQVFPQFDTAVEGGIVAGEDLTKQTLDTPVVLDVENILDVPQASEKPKSAESYTTKYRAIAEKPAANTVPQTHTGITFIPSSLQFLQPQVITVTFPNPTTDSLNNTATQLQQHHAIQTKKSVTKTKPLLLPKLSTTNITPTKEKTTTNTSGCSSATSTLSTPHSEPSSASLTPTSQLPIKERLKAILNQSSKTRPADWSDKSCSSKIVNRSAKTNAHKSTKDDTMERRRAASTRYRHKMRNEYKDLRKRNTELHAENDKLKDRIKQLEVENSRLKSASLQPVLASSNLPALGVPAQIQIPASTIHLVMNIPKLVVPCGTSDLNNSAMLKGPLRTVVGDIHLKTLVAIIILLNILGQCEMSIYPGLRRRPLQQATGSFEVNSDFLTQLMEENARRRLQHQFEQHLELINMQLMRQRQREERLRERYRHDQLAAMAAENEEYEYMQKFKEQHENNINNNVQQYDQYDNTNVDFSYKYPTINSLENQRGRIKFAVPPTDPRYYEVDDVRTEDVEESDNNEDNVIRENDDVDEEADIEGVEVDKEEDLDSRVLEEYEEYKPNKDDDNKEAKSTMGSTMILSPAQAGVVSSSGANTNFHRIKPQTAAAAAAAGVNSLNVQQMQNGVAPARQEITTLIDKLNPKVEQNPQTDINDGHMVLREHLGMKGEMGMYVVALIAGVSAAATVGLFVLGIAWYTFHNKSKAAADVEYPAYGVTGPNKDISPSGDRKLAQSAQMYHYQHQKQQIIAMENRQNNEENCEMSYVESDDDNEEGDYTVYECPGLAPTGEMEVKNPLFLDDTPVTPALGNHPITQVSAQQPTVKKLFEKTHSTTNTTLPTNTTLAAAAASAASSEDKKQKKSKK
ncbi:uncharacterized protein LOC135961513 [Calliphora vicina]|uniref:uncharacterized protein LOC135961513 n=1 Tax=Calliphora vicina TaxID=7373 RepID=UPI00325B87A6